MRDIRYELMELATDPRVGSEILGYRLEGVLGRGGMGVVFRGYDPRLKRHVAVKLLAPEYAADARFRERFLSETERAASLSIPTSSRSTTQARWTASCTSSCASRTEVT